MKFLRSGQLPIIVLTTLAASGCDWMRSNSGTKLHLVGLSFPRSGTVSVAQIFSNYRSIHEYMPPESIFALLDYSEKKISGVELSQILRYRQEMGNMEVDSSTFFFISPNEVIATYSDAKFFFMLRNCKDWIVSVVDRFTMLFDKERLGRNAYNLRFLSRFGRYFSSRLNAHVLLSAPELQKNAEALAQDLAVFWRIHVIETLTAMEKLPPDRRLVLRLKDLDQSIEKLANFARVPIDTLNQQYTHLNQDTRHEQTLALLDSLRLDRIAAPQQKTVEEWIKSHKGLVAESPNYRTAMTKPPAPRQP